MACFKNVWDKIKSWIDKVFDNTPDGTPRKDDKEKESEENKEKE